MISVQTAVGCTEKGNNEKTEGIEGIIKQRIDGKPTNSLSPTIHTHYSGCRGACRHAKSAMHFDKKKQKQKQKKSHCIVKCYQQVVRGMCTDHGEKLVDC